MTTRNAPTPRPARAVALPLCDKSADRNRTLSFLLLAGTLAALAFSLTGCASRAISTHGHVIPQHRLDAVQVGSTTKEGVRRLLGSPPITGSFGENSWIYMSEKTQEEIFGDSTLQGRTIYVISFDANDIVDDITTRTAADAQPVEFSKQETPTSGQSMGVIDQLLGNIGVK